MKAIVMSERKWAILMGRGDEGVKGYRGGGRRRRESGAMPRPRWMTASFMDAAR